MESPSFDSELVQERMQLFLSQLVRRDWTPTLIDKEQVRLAIMPREICSAKCSAKFVVKGAGEEYHAPDIELKRKSRTNTSGEYTC